MIYEMAKVLASQVPEIKDRIACRHMLAMYGFTDQEISVHLHGAQRLARKLRGAEADRLYWTQFNPPPQRKIRHG